MAIFLILTEEATFTRGLRYFIQLLMILIHDLPNWGRMAKYHFRR